MIDVEPATTITELGCEGSRRDVPTSVISATRGATRTLNTLALGPAWNPDCARLARTPGLVHVGHVPCRVAAQRLELSLDLRTLVACERDRRKLGEFKLDTIPTARLRVLLERELARRPELTRDGEKR